MRIPARLLGGLLISCIVAAPAFAGFASTEQYLAAVGRVSGAGGAEFYTTIWVTDLTPAPVSFTFEFLKAGQANTSPPSFSDNLAPGQTKVYENVVQSKLGLSGVLGGARVTSTGEILVAERIYNQAPGADLGDTEGLFFAGVPKSLSISPGQSASIQGINQGGAENFRYNFALLETSGGAPTVNVQLFDGDGTMLGQKAYPMQPYEQIQPNVKDLFAGVATTNGRITATVTGGTGSVIIAGAQLANVSQDSSGFEMSFRDQLLGGGGAAGVTSLNTLTGALSLVAGNGITITPSGSDITIAANGGGSGGFSLPYSNSASNPTGSVFAITNSAAPPSGSFNSAVVGIDGSPSGFFGKGFAQDNAGVVGDSGNGDGVMGLGSKDGVVGVGQFAGVAGYGVPPPAAAVPTFGVGGVSFGKQGAGVLGAFGLGGPAFSSYSAGVEGIANDQWGVFGYSASSDGVVGFTDSSDNPTAIAGIVGFNTSANNTGYLGGADYAVKGTSPHGTAILGRTSASGGFGVQGENTPSQTDGYLGGQGYGVFGAGPIGVWGGPSLSTTATAGALSAHPGVYGQSPNGSGVWGEAGQSSSGAGVYGANLASGNYGELGTPSYGVYAAGGFAGSGAKYFVEPHPTDPTKEIRYVCLEGRESGTYFRGSGRIVGGFATIEVPEDFRAVTSEKGLTVQLTPSGDFASLVVKSLGLGRIVVQSNRDVEFFYMVNGVRKAFADHQPVVENVDFVPRSPTDDHLTAGLPAESLRRLKASGILNADGSINLATAHQLGWDRRPGWNGDGGRATAK